MSCKEEFRQFAILHGFNLKVYLDSSTFVHQCNIAGCFSDADMYAVYETDDHGDAQNVRYHCSEQLAYADLASRFGYEFTKKE